MADGRAPTAGQADTTPPLTAGWARTTRRGPRRLGARPSSHHLSVRSRKKTRNYSSMKQPTEKKIKQPKIKKSHLLCKKTRNYSSMKQPTEKKSNNQKSKK